MFESTLPKNSSAQDPIGWDNCFRGYIPSKWGTRQDNYFRTHKIHMKAKRSGKRWATALISFVWHSCHSLWSTRCDGLHDPSEPGGGRDREEMTVRIRAMYHLQDRVNNVDRDIFAMPLEKRLLLPTRQLKLWALQFQPVLAKAVLTAQIQDHSATHDIRTFLTKRPSPTG